MENLYNISKKYNKGENRVASHNRGTNNPNQGGDINFHGYTARYEKLFSDLRELKVNYLEIGVFQGRKLATFAEYFPFGRIYGVDISDKEFNLIKPELISLGAFKNNNLISVNIGDSTNKKKTWDEEIFKFPMFDIIIDDGIHKPFQQHQTLLNFWEKLKPTGIYVIEDVGNKFLMELKNLLKSTNHYCYVSEILPCNFCNLIVLRKQL